MKLTNVMRKMIIDRIIVQVRPPREVKLRASEHALALRLVRHRYGPDIFERCRALPEGWLNVHKHVCFDYKLAQVLPRKRRIEGVGHRRYEHFYPGSQVELNEYAPLPNSMTGCWTREMVGEGLFEEVVALFNAKIELEDDVDLLRRQIGVTLMSFTTVEKLAELWPEGYAELPAEMMEPVVNGLPAPRIADLNERIEKFKEAA